MRIEAEDILGAAQEKGWSEDDVQDLFEELGLTDWARQRNKAYPDFYAFALGRYPANPFHVKRFRRAIAAIPRVNPLDYDILLNMEGADLHRPGPTWDFVKWVATPELQGEVPGLGWLTTIVLEPFPFHSIPATIRSLDSMGDRDFEVILRNTIMREGGPAQRRELRESNDEKMEALKRQRAEEDLALGEEMRSVVKKLAEEEGV